MARYIDAEDTTKLSWLREAFPLLENFYLIPKDTPTADVRPEKHGEWKINSDGYYPYCSVCLKEPQGRVMTNFCPNCGAKMDGKDV